MSTVKQTLATAAALTKTLASLANGSGRAATARDNTTNLYTAADIRVQIKTGASGVSSTGYVNVYLLRSEDGTSYDDAFAGSDAAYTPVNAILLGTMVCNANATTYHKVFSTEELGITLPAKYSIGVQNNTGAALDSTEGSHVIQVREKYLTVA